MGDKVLINLSRMLNAADRVVEFTEGMRHEDFSKNKLLRDGVIRNLEIMREASLQLDHAFKQDYAYVAWEVLSSSGNGKPQDFAQFDTDKIWLLIRYNIPQMRDQIIKMIADVKR